MRFTSTALSILLLALPTLTLANPCASGEIGVGLTDPRIGIMGTRSPARAPRSSVYRPAPRSSFRATNLPPHNVRALCLVLRKYIIAVRSSTRAHPGVPGLRRRSRAARRDIRSVWNLSKSRRFWHRKQCLGIYCTYYSGSRT